MFPLEKRNFIRIRMASQRCTRKCCWPTKYDMTKQLIKLANELKLPRKLKSRKTLDAFSPLSEVHSWSVTKNSQTVDPITLGLISMTLHKESKHIFRPFMFDSETPISAAAARTNKKQKIFYSLIKNSTLFSMCRAWKMSFTLCKSFRMRRRDTRWWSHTKTDLCVVSVGVVDVVGVIVAGDGGTNFDFGRVTKWLSILVIRHSAHLDTFDTTMVLRLFPFPWAVAQKSNRLFICHSISKTKAHTHTRHPCAPFVHRNFVFFTMFSLRRPLKLKTAEWTEVYRIFSRHDNR